MARSVPRPNASPERWAYWGGAFGALLVAGKPRPPSDAERPIIPPMRASTAEQILAERLARGEIDAEEYRQRRDALRG